MHHNNRASILRREILARLSALILTDRLVEDIESVPYQMTLPGWETVRCCVHHDRAILRLRLAARLGFDVASLDDVEKPLADYARQALSRTSPPRSGLFLLEEACNKCVASPYLVTDVCQGCLARPCASNCPKKAINFVDGKARIDASLCVGCGICAQACPYKAIIKVPVPCEEACPVGAIHRDADGKHRIDKEACVECGKCVKECPFGAVMEPSHLVEAIRAVKSNRPVVALLAPATIAQFPGAPGSLSAAVASLGFSSVVEVAAGAEATTGAEANELIEHMEHALGPLATSCCPAWTKTARAILPAPSADGSSTPVTTVSSTPSPMVFTARALKAARAEATTAEPLLVFISPCLAKRREAEETGSVHLTLSAEELGAWFVAASTEIATMAERPFDAPDGKHAPRPAEKLARGFGASGGVAAAVSKRVESLGKAAPRCLSINGVDKNTIKDIRRWETLAPEADLIEVMFCQGGCVNGPCSLANPRAALLSLGRYAEAGTAWAREA